MTSEYLLTTSKVSPLARGYPMETSRWYLFQTIILIHSKEHNSCSSNASINLVINRWLFLSLIRSWRRRRRHIAGMRISVVASVACHILQHILNRGSIWRRYHRAVQCFLNLHKMILININTHQHHLSGDLFFRLRIRSKIHLAGFVIPHMTVIALHTQWSGKVVHHTIQSIFWNILWQDVQVSPFRLIAWSKCLQHKYHKGCNQDSQKTFFHALFFFIKYFELSWWI